MCIFQHRGLWCLCLFISAHVLGVYACVFKHMFLVFMCVYFSTQVFNGRVSLLQHTCLWCLCAFVSTHWCLCVFHSVRSYRMCCVCKQAKTYFITQVFGVCVSLTVQARAGGHWRGGGPCNGLRQNRFCMSKATGKGVPVTCQTCWNATKLSDHGSF